MIIFDQSQSVSSVLVSNKEAIPVNEPLIASKRQRSHDVNNENQTICTNSSSSSSNDNVTTSDGVLGVRLIWVSEKTRRMGVAKSLVDMARRHFFFGVTGGIAKSQIAFSQPTDEGRDFAFSYCNADSILIYSLSGY